MRPAEQQYNDVTSLPGLRRVPQHDAIASGVRHPGEATVLVIFAVRINLHPLRLECLEQSVEIEALYVFNPLLRVIGKPALHVPLTLSLPLSYWRFLIVGKRWATTRDYFTAANCRTLLRKESSSRCSSVMRLIWLPISW